MTAPVESRGCFITEVTISSDNDIVLAIESEEGTVDMDDCVAVNNAFLAVFDQEKEDYSLTVTSAGLDQPFKILKQYQKLLALDEVKLDYEEDALHAIAAKALEKHTGARGLRAILEEYMLDIMYEIPKDDSIGQVIITREYIEGTGGPRILLRGQEIPLIGMAQ